MENSPSKSGKGSPGKSKKHGGKEPELKAPEKLESENPKLSREHDFTHTHPTHAKHKNFGLDHEPGAL